MTVDVMVHHTAAVASAKPNALVVGDMPWLSYHTLRRRQRCTTPAVSSAKAAPRRSSSRVASKRLDVIRAVLDAEIPVMGHLGLTPQSVHAMGGYRVQGKQAAAAYELISDAKALADAGVFAIVLEGVPDRACRDRHREISRADRSASVPGVTATARCSSSTTCSASAAANTCPSSSASTRSSPTSPSPRWSSSSPMSQSGDFPGEAETYHMPDESEEILRDLNETARRTTRRRRVTDASSPTKPWSSSRRPFGQACSLQVPAVTTGHPSPGLVCPQIAKRSGPRDGGRFGTRRFALNP